MVDRKNVATKSKATKSSSAAKVAASAGVVVAASIGGYTVGSVNSRTPIHMPNYAISDESYSRAVSTLSRLRARDDSNKGIPKYEPEKHSNSWIDEDDDGCNTRCELLKKALGVDENSATGYGIGIDYYTGEALGYQAGAKGGGIDIDHIVSKSDAWNSGGHGWDSETWKKFINDTDNLIVVSSSVNSRKQNKDITRWKPINEYLCRYTVAQILIKEKYDLTVTNSEKAEMANILNGCKP